MGVGAIVGGGILALAGVACATTGPSAMVAFALNGLIALLTALSFAEMASKFPESGGTYTFAKKVLSVQAAFTIGWVVWFASMVAAVLYALGLSYFLLVMVEDIIELLGKTVPIWLHNHYTTSGLAVLLTIALAIGLTRKATSLGQWANATKLGLFALLIFGGLWAVACQPIPDTIDCLDPFFSNGLIGVVQAMGYTFITFQGFDLIAAIGGEVEEPEKNLPKAIIISLLVALAVYLPLLFIISTVGTPGNDSIALIAQQHPEELVALSAQSYLGVAGYWLVVIVAILSMFSALQANLFAASRIVRSMARDRTLHTALAVISFDKGTPIIAIYVTAIIVAAILLVVPDVAEAGAASSLIFLITFALSHWVSILIRQRSYKQPPPFQSPLFPLVPVIGGVSCIALAIFQGITVPAAGLIVLTWLIVGLFLFLTLFSKRARVIDAKRIAIEPELVTLRGHTPLVLVPIANPKNAEAMVSLAGTLVPSDIGRIIMLNIINGETAKLNEATIMLPKLLEAAEKAQVRAEALTTVADETIEEIARVATIHRCESVVIGLNEISKESEGTPVERLLGTIDADIVVFRSGSDSWNLDDAKKILIPIGGKAVHEHLLARLLGSLMRTGRRDITFLRIVPPDTSEDEIRKARKALQHLAEEELHKECDIEIVKSSEPVKVITEKSEDFNLIILGVQKVNRTERLFGNFTRMVAQDTPCPIIVICSRD